MSFDYELFRDNILTADYAAKRLGVSVESVKSVLPVRVTKDGIDYYDIDIWAHAQDYDKEAYAEFQTLVEKMKTLSAIKQYHKNKERFPDCVCLFRIGYFYEAFFDDAEVLCRVCGLTITHRAIGEAELVPLTGVLAVYGDKYIAALVKAGHRVAVCEQLEREIK